MTHTCASCGKPMGFSAHRASEEDEAATELGDVTPPYLLLIIGAPEYFQYEMMVGTGDEEPMGVTVPVLDKEFVPNPDGLVLYCSEACTHTYTGRKAFFSRIEDITGPILIKYVDHEYIATHGRGDIKQFPMVSLSRVFSLLGIDFDAILRSEVRNTVSDIVELLAQRVDAYL